jgi:hypothetical protein
MFYGEAPGLSPRAAEAQADLQWWDVALDGTTGHEFHQQITDLEHVLEAGWQTKLSERSGNPVYTKPSVIVLYRKDRAFAMHDLIPRDIGGPQPFGYDLVLAAQPYRCATAAEAKVKTVLAPLARAQPAGPTPSVQSTGHDPGMEIVRRIWPNDEPFATPRHMLIKELDRQLNVDGANFHFEHFDDAQALFTYNLHAMPNEVTNRLTTSTALAAWNAAVYVAQIDDERRRRDAERGLHADHQRRRAQARWPLVPGRELRRRPHVTGPAALRDSVDGGLAAVDGDVGAVDVGGVVGAEEHRQLRHLDRLPARRAGVAVSTCSGGRHVEELGRLGGADHPGPDDVGGRRARRPRRRGAS